MWTLSSSSSSSSSSSLSLYLSLSLSLTLSLTLSLSLFTPSLLSLAVNVLLIYSWTGSNSIMCWESADSAWCMKGSGMIDMWRSNCLTLPHDTQICLTCNWSNGLSDRKLKRWWICKGIQRMGTSFPVGVKGIITSSSKRCPTGTSIPSCILIRHRKGEPSQKRKNYCWRFKSLRAWHTCTASRSFMAICTHLIS